MKTLLPSAIALAAWCAAHTLAQPSAAPAALVAPPAQTTAHRDLAYVTGGHARQKLDLYLPAQGVNLPLVILIHGGAWLEGDKSGENAAEFLDLGYAVVSINYRLSSQARFPAQIEDCKAAVRWLRANAHRYGLDPNRFGAYGWSAGGHLAALLGTTGEVKSFDVGENLELSSRVQAVADFFGPTDFLQMDTHRVPGGQVHDGPDSPEALLVGGPIQESKANVAQANPITYITKSAAPFLIVHGSADPLVPHHQSEILAQALTRAEVGTTFYTVEGGGHGGFKDPKVPPMLHGFFDLHLKNSKSRQK